jgi:hypothetical protein
LSFELHRAAFGRPSFSAENPMTDTTVVLHPVESCNLGRHGADGVALRINFAMSEAERKSGPYKHAVFGLSREMAQGLMKALSAVLEEPTTPAKH